MKFPQRLIGKQIVAVEQEPVRARGLGVGQSWSVQALVLEDGTRVLLSAEYADDEPIVTVGDVVRGPAPAPVPRSAAKRRPRL